MRTKLDIQAKITELRSTSPDWFLQFTKMDLPPEVKARIAERLPYIKAGILLGLAWTLGGDDTELVQTLFDLDKLKEQGIELDDFGIG